MSQPFVPVTVRYGLRQLPEGPFEGLPGHLIPMLDDWVFRHIGRDKRLADRIVFWLRLEPMSQEDRYGNEDLESSTTTIRRLLNEEPIAFLDVVEYVLAHKTAVLEENVDRWVFNEEEVHPAEELSAILLTGASVWTISTDKKRLERRVGNVVVDGYVRTISPADSAANELEQAWAKVYGLHPDPSDAWDHAIKACETILRPVITPNNPSATLANIIGELSSANTKFKLTLNDNAINAAKRIDPLASLANMLHLIWPNPDRHGGGGRTPTQGESEAVVQLAIMVVQWSRSGVVVKK